MKLSVSLAGLASLYTLIASVTTASGAALDVYAPPVLEPKQGDVWVIGEKRDVVWDTSSPPKQITNSKGTIRLRKGNSTLESVNLGSGFSILDGKREVTVPDVEEGDDYRIVLFGDSGNWSEVFSIIAGTLDLGPLADDMLTLFWPIWQRDLHEYSAAITMGRRPGIGLMVGRSAASPLLYRLA
ncbi:hypothetical protein NMY22_g4844 [Coprinellus aureogranulatus]|nr:hypothetical protein NMY22_g4844 [Coprinellus aureogranulatus]